MYKRWTTRTRRERLALKRELIALEIPHKAIAQEAGVDRERVTQYLNAGLYQQPEIAAAIVRLKAQKAAGERSA